MSKPKLKLDQRVPRLSVVSDNTASPKQASTVLVVLAFAAVYIIWGSTYLAIKYAIGTLPPFLMAATRFLIAGSILFAWARLRGASTAGQQPLLQWRRAIVIGALLLLGGNGGVTWAEQYISSGLAALVVASEPLWIVMWNLISGGSRPNAKASVGLITGLAGVALLVSGGFGESHASTTMSLIGAAVVIAASMSWAGGSVYSIHRPVQASAPLASGMQMLCGGALLLLMGLFTGEFSKLDLRNASWLSLGAFLYLIVFGSIVAFTAYSYLLRNVSPASSATYAYVNPVVAVLLGWAIAGEAVTPRMMIAAAIIVASVVIITTYGKERPHAKETARPSEPDQPSDDPDPCPTHPCA
ncbi:MAG TPA: EamA family transporter [Pyrinomonadaceae bacterium]|nr:EamA family transporter [Pyrinomonadaceae bacterium]